MKFIILLIFFTGVNSFASEVELVWRRIDTQYSYKDPNQECTTKSSVGNTHIAGEAFLSLEVEDGKVLAARLANHPNVWPFSLSYKAIDLEPSEIATIELFRDNKSQLWVKKFMLTERLAKWLIHFPSQRHYWCKIPFVPQTINSPPQNIPFEMEGVEQGVEISYGEWIKIEGKRPDGVGFEESMRLVQRIAD